MCLRVGTLVACGRGIDLAIGAQRLVVPRRIALLEHHRIFVTHQALGLLHRTARPVEVGVSIRAPDLAELLERTLVVGAPALREPARGIGAVAEDLERGDAGLPCRSERLAEDALDAEAA